MMNDEQCSDSAPTAFGGVFTFFSCALQAEEFPAQPLEVLRGAAGVIILDHGDPTGRGFDNPRACSDVCSEEVVAENALYLLYELPVEPSTLVVIVEHDLDRGHRLDEPLLNPRHPVDHGDHSLQPVHPAGDDKDDLIGGVDPDLSRTAQPGRSVNDDVVITPQRRAQLPSQ